MTQLILNNAKTTVTDISVFYTNYRRYSNLFNTLKKLSQVVTILKDIKQLKYIYKEISKDIKYN